jgi:alkanesulfonate monooxygenase SsuD/methylene tetrahydromethanopterin reductase-like flavin-dependent oxidoreductase (luciferase family)
VSGLHFGILPTPIYGRETPAEQQIREHEELVSTAAALGFDHMVAGQHFLGAELRYFQPVPYLAHLAHAAPQMHVVTGIMLLSMATPADMAEQVATLDAVTGGKAVFGVGLGYADREFRAFGIDGKQKISRFEECLTIIRRLWSGEPVEYAGRYWTIDEVTPAVLPVQPGGPPVWIGGQAEPAIKRAALLGDAWYAPPFPSHDGLADLRRTFLRVREEAGLPTDGAFPLRRELIVADSRDQARAIAVERSAARYATYKSWGLSGSNTPVRAEPGIDVDEQFILGSSEEVVDQLGRLRDDLGMTHFMFKSHWQGVPHRDAMEQLVRFGTEVLPKLT